MPHVELPRPLEDYFAFAELEGTSDARRFTLTCPYFSAQELGRLQWWWRVSHLELSSLGDAGLAERKAREVERFCRHIERWLANTGQRLKGDDAIPRIEAMPAAVVEPPAIALPAEDSLVALRPTRVA
jgi:hypothetical protein